MSYSLRPHRLQPARLLCPWDFPGNSTGVDCHFLLQGIFPTKGSNPGLPHCREMLYHLSHQGSRGRPGFNPRVGKIPWRRERLPTPVFWPGEFHGPYRPCGRKESNITEQLSLSECLWGVWNLILNVISPLLLSCWGSSLPLDMGIFFRWDPTFSC